MTAKLWHIEMFGGLRVVQDGAEPVEFPPQQSSALLAYLALSLETNHTREELAAHLWPEEEPERVQQKMRRSLHTLRRRMEQPPFDQADLLLSTRQTLRLDPARVCTDVTDFKHALLASTRSTDLREREQHLACAVQIYRGELLPGFYEECFLPIRNHLADLYSDALHTLTQLYAQSGDLDRALECARRTVALDPLKEEAHCTLMQLFAAMGQPSAAWKQYKELERILGEELGEKPSQATQELMETLRKTGQPLNPLAVQPVAVEPLLPQQASTGSDSAESGNIATSLQSFAVPTFATRRHGRMPIIAALAVSLILGVTFLSTGSLLRHRTGSARDRQTTATIQPSAIVPIPTPKTLWVNRYVPDQDEKENSEPTGIATDAAGNIYLTGFIQTLHHDVDYLTLKYAPDGRLLWRRRYNGPGNDVDRARSIAIDREGNVYVTGDSSNGKGNGLTRLSGQDWATIKYDASGKQLWVARYNGPDDGEDVPAKISVDREGGVYVAGYSGTRAGLYGKFVPCKDFLVVKYDALGRQLWTRREKGSKPYLPAEATDMALDAVGNIYVTGWYSTDRLGAGKRELMTLKYASNGDTLWRKTYPGKGAGDTAARRIAVDESGDVTVTGDQYDGDVMNNGTLNDIVTLQYDSEGNEKWRRVYDGGQSNDSPNALAVDAAGRAYVAGYGRPGKDYITLAYDHDGGLAWDQSYNGVGNGQDVATNLCLDSAGNVLVAGYAYGGNASQHAGTDSDYVTIKYDPGGRVVWKAVYDSAALGDRAYAMAVDRNNSVIVSGQSDRGSGRLSITTIKYAP